MILHLRLENWKSHSSSQFYFSRGANILLGRMGAGKSSVLDAICFALYGNFPKMSRRDQSTENLVSSGSQATYALVELEFEKGGKRYRIERRVGKKISEAEARQDGKLVQKGARAVTEFVQEILGVDYDLFTRAIYSEQNKIDYLLLLNPRSRKEEIDGLLGLGQFDLAREAAQAASTKLYEQAELLSSSCQPERIAEAEKKIAELESQKAGRQEAIFALAEKNERLSRLLNEKKEALLALEKARAEWMALRSESQQAKGALERLREECHGKKRFEESELRELSSKKAEAEREVAVCKSKIKDAQALLSSAKSSMAVLESKLKAAEAKGRRAAEISSNMNRFLEGKSLLEIERLLADLQKDAALHAESQSRLLAEAEEMENAVKVLAEAGAKCPVCDSDLPEGRASALREEKKRKLEQKRKEASLEGQAASQRKSEAERLQKTLQQAKVMEKELAMLKEEAEGAELARKELEDAIRKKSQAEQLAESLEDALAACEKKAQEARSSLEEALRANQLFQDLKDAEEKLIAAEQRLSQMKFSEEEHEAWRKEAENLRVERAKTEAQLQAERSQLGLIEQMLKKERETLAELERKRILAAKYSEAASSMVIYKNSLLSAQSEMRNLFVEEINQALGEIWPSIYPYGDYPEVKLEADDKDYRLMMRKAGGWADVDAIASGGERACLCLALRIAFAAVLTPDLSWLILDEPTHNLDSEAISMLSQAIGKKIPSIVEQTFVITHEPALAEGAEGAVFRLERDKSKNQPTQVKKES